MSLFGSLLRDFDEDPFGFHREQFRRLERMMDSFSMSPFENMFAPFGFPPMIAPTAFNHRHQAHANHHNRGAMMPYGYGREIMFPSMSSVFSDLERMTNDPHCHMYSSSSVMTYTTGQDGRPQVYQATSSTRTAPGGVKETRRSMSDTASGIQSMAIGHHLGERAHILERMQNRITGERDESQEFINLEEDEAQAFDDEWQLRTNQSSARQSIAAAPQKSNYYEPPEQPAPLAITAGPSSQERHSRKRENRSDDEGGRSEKSRKSHKHKHSSKPKHETKRKKEPRSRKP